MSQIALALDVPNLDAAKDLLDKVTPYIGAVKIGLELFTAVGPEVVKITKLPVILDLKLHDIPETVARTIQVGGDLGVKFMTMHVQQRKTMEMAVKAAEPFGMTLLGVTVLTSITMVDFNDLHWTASFDEFRRVLQLASFAVSQCGLKGLVCSPQEVRALRISFTDKEQPFLLVPGVRPTGADLGDQKRVGTPKQAIDDGADLIVIGRPIRDAADPAQAASDILKSIENN